MKLYQHSKEFLKRLVPNSKPALDCPIVYPYAPNAVLIGFISSFVGGLVSMVIMIFTGSVVILPGVVPHFSVVQRQVLLVMHQVVYVELHWSFLPRCAY